jgi:CheY-like chemotaxis protein
MKFVLIAEDEYDIALALELVLSESGYRVATVPNGQEALYALAKEKPDLILMDIMMPVLTGLETCLKIRAMPAYAEIPIVLMSAAPAKGRQADYGWSAFIRKPFNVDDVLRVLSNFLA